MSELARRIHELAQEITAACHRAGRDPAEIKLVAVSKNFEPDIIQEAYQLGLQVLGENRAQELKRKKPQLPEDIEWHLIGTLQRNKVKDVIGEVALIHSVDSLQLAQEISKQAQKKGIEVNILLQVNIAKEASKHGFAYVEVLEAIKEICLLSGIKIRGLMTVAPIAPEPELVRPVFRQLKELSCTIERLAIPGVEMQELSMGMSDDFAVAIEEGATLLRIGSRIFGHRTYI